MAERRVIVKGGRNGMAAVLAFMSSFLIFWGGLSLLLRRRQRLEDRVSALAGAVAKTESAQAAPVGDPADGPSAQARFGKRRETLFRSVAARINRHVESAGVTLSPAHWRLVGIVFAAPPLVIGLLARNAVPAILLECALFGLAVILAARRRTVLRREMESSLGDVVTVVAGALRAGYSFLQAIDILASETKGRMGDEFKRMLREMSLGVGVEEALTHAAERVASTDFDLIVAAVLVQRQVGGNLAEVLDLTGETIRERIRIKGEIRTLTAQGRMSLWIFTLLTPGIALALFLLNPSYIAALWQSSAGIAMVVGAVIGQALGALVIRNIVRIEV
ncbi:MAG: type II secretion system F family protein [Bacilli bacterium]